MMKMMVAVILPVFLAFTLLPAVAEGIDNCLSSPCMNGASCVDNIDSYTCNCLEIYTGVHCERIRINYCSSRPCMNGAICVNNDHNYTCSCTEDYTGVNCQNRGPVSECDSEPCKNNGLCVDSGGEGYICLCKTGFIGIHCGIDINECASNPCLNGGTCHVSDGSYRCVCAEGFIGNNCELNDKCDRNRCLCDGLILCPIPTTLSNQMISTTTPILNTIVAVPDASGSISFPINIIVGLAVVVGIVVFIGLCVFIVWKRRKLSNERETIPMTNTTNKNSRVTEDQCCNPDQIKPARVIFSKYETARKMLEIGEVIGNGAYGVVHKGFLMGPKEGVLVAVKSMKDYATCDMKENFLDEIQLIIEIGNHPNILSMLGCITGSEPYYLIAEFMMYGDLLSFLRKCKQPKFAIEDEIYNITEMQQLQIARQIALGMEYISSTRYYHGDLAARNILVGEGLVVKIADFGMADDIYAQEYKRLAPGKKRAIKWVSLETNVEGKCTIQSDVWSYGIVLYEIMTLGDVPYPGMDPHIIVSELKRGYRMEKPDNCSKEIYEIMRNCWQHDPESRPSFKALATLIDDMLATNSGYLDMLGDDSGEDKLSCYVDMQNADVDEKGQNVDMKPIHVNLPDIDIPRRTTQNEYVY